MGVLFSFLGNVLLYTCFGSLIFVFLSLAGLLRLLPLFLSFIPKALWVVLVLSYRLYALIINLFSPVTESLFRVNLHVGLARLFVCISLSAIFGYLFLYLFGLPFAWWSIGIILLHGITVSLVWDEIEQPGSLQLGERVK